MSAPLMFFCFLIPDSISADPIRSSLEGKEELWFICLLISSGVVAVGCLLEVGETWSSLKTWWNLRKSEVDPSPSWHAPAAAIGLLLVILGVIGEGIFEGLVSMKETDLRAHDEQVLSDTIINVGTAEDAAEAAQKAAERAETASGGAVAIPKKPLNRQVTRANWQQALELRPTISLRTLPRQKNKPQMQYHNSPLLSSG